MTRYRPGITAAANRAAVPLPENLLGLEQPLRLDGEPDGLFLLVGEAGPAEAEVLGRLRNPKTGQAAGVVTVGDWLAHWLVSRTSPAASTVRGYAAHVRLYLGPYLGEVLLTELTVGQVQAMFAAIIRQHQALGTPVSAATLTRIRATLRAALTRRSAGV